MTVKFLKQATVPVDELRPYPKNANHGDVNTIAESLEQLSQYRSIVALADGTILAGHHVWRAAKNLGMKTLRVDFIEADEKDAKKINLVDNRSAEIGPGPDLELLLHNLEELDGDLIATGYSEDYVKLLEDAVIGPPETSGEEPPPEPGSGDAGGLRRLTLMVDEKLADHWEAHRKLFTDDGSALGYLLGGG